MPQHMHIRFGTSGDITLTFKLRNTPVANLWAERMSKRTPWQLDHPDRFYGFGTAEQERDRAVAMMVQCINTINSYEPIIHREFEYTQDCLNYLHNIFEQYHGLLDQQHSDYWHRAPDQVKQALAELNLAVHRCESVANGPLPRFVCTWYGMPKICKLSTDLQQEYGVPKIEFGTVYLNYCEIGKTVEDLTNDNDRYIGDDAFRPFSYYSADFNVAFFEKDLSPRYGPMQNYIEQHQEFFLAKGITSVYNVQAQPLRFPVADLEYTGSTDTLLSEIASRQWIYEVILK